MSCPTRPGQSNLYFGKIIKAPKIIFLLNQNKIATRSHIHLSRLSQRPLLNLTASPSPPLDRPLLLNPTTLLFSSTATVLPSTHCDGPFSSTPHLISQVNQIKGRQDFVT